MKMRFKLAAAPVSYTTSQIPGVREHQAELHESLWADSTTVAARLKEFVFLRSSLVNDCHV